PGLVAHFCLDGDLVDQGGSLAATVRGARPELTTEGLLEDLAAVSPSVAGHLAALLDTDPAVGPSLDPCLDRAGLRARTEELDAPASDAWRDALEIEAWEPSERVPGIRVTRAGPEARLALGDVLVAVGGQPVTTPDDVAFVLRDVAAGHPIRLEVRRHGERVELDATAPDLTGVEHVARSLRRVVPIEQVAP
ncbi:MAG: PDZ domain-containing protein, partial [Myxococcales bacterium]|nr:PDZ domain-containing protein [Myxococcales bacterium]